MGKTIVMPDDQRSPPAPRDRIVERPHYNRFAGRVSALAASPWIFVVVGVIVAGVTVVFHSAASANLVIELAALAMVVLIHARARATERAMHEKLDALTEGVAALLDHLNDEDSHHLADRIQRVREVAGVEKRI